MGENYCLLLVRLHNVLHSFLCDLWTYLGKIIHVSHLYGSDKVINFVCNLQHILKVIATDINMILTCLNCFGGGNWQCGV